MTREEFKAKVSMALGSMGMVTWGDFLEKVWQLHLEASNHWIPVEERLPEVGEKVIFYSPDLNDWLSGALQQDGTWWNEEYGTHFYDVTHWMEIVPPRKEE